jgi:hypothetical protein
LHVLLLQAAAGAVTTVADGAVTLSKVRAAPCVLRSLCCASSAACSVQQPLCKKQHFKQHMWVSLHFYQTGVQTFAGFCRLSNHRELDTVLHSNFKQQDMLLHCRRVL